MDRKQSEIHLKPIGIVRNGIESSNGRHWEEVISEIAIRRDLTEALNNLEEFSHIIVLFWAHKATTRVPNRIHPGGNPAFPLVGLFATRSPDRPNPIGKTTVKLLEHRENILTVKGLDAFDGTPIIDIKPYIPNYDSAKRAKVPEWVIRIQKKSC